MVSDMDQTPDALRHLDPVRRHFLGLHRVPPPTDLPAILRQASTAIDELVLEAMHANGWTELSASDLIVLDHLRDGMLPAPTLAERLHVSRQAVPRRVSRLVGFGLVRQEGGGLDTRVTLVSLTSRGRRAADALADAIAQATGYVVDSVPGEHLERMLVDLTVFVRELPGA